MLQNRGYTERVLTHVGRYQIVGELGRGAMGVVYKALDPTIGRTVALKAIRLSEFHDAEERERIHQRLWREAQSAGILSHPNIVTIYDVVEQDSSAFIVMEFVNGHSLANLLRKGQLPGRDDLLRYLRQVAEALDYAHKRGVVHRDVKPGNILIAEPDAQRASMAKVADFGVAKFISQDTTHSGTMIGTPNYISPEQIEGLTSDGRADQFSLAVVIYELLGGQKPFDSDNLSTLFYQICRQDPKPVEQLNPQLPPATGRVLLRGLAKNPQDRFASCTDLMQELESTLASEQAIAAEAAVPRVELPPAVRPRLPRLDETDTLPRRRSRRWGIAAGVAAVLLGSFVALQRFRQEAPAVQGSTSAKPPVPAKQTASASPVPEKTRVTVPPPVKAGGASSGRSSPSLVPVSFHTDPAGARVEVDGRSDVACVAPCNLDLTYGRHTLRATANGFNLAQRIFTLPADADMNIALEQSIGVLMLTSQPSGSDVTVDGKTSGQTPLTLRLPAGPHQVLLSNGDQKHEETVVVKAEEVESRNLRWQ